MFRQSRRQRRTLANRVRGFHDDCLECRVFLLFAQTVQDLGGIEAI